MQLLIIRHAIAEEREDFARSGGIDALRPLTAEGRKKMREVVAGLRVVTPTIDLLATSPLTRAVQTAEIVAEQYDGLAPQETDALSPDHKSTAFLRWLRRQSRAEVVAVVGHEPHLGQLASWLLSGREDSFVTLKKGAACLLRFDGLLRAGEATLLWSLAPAHLRRLAD